MAATIDQDQRALGAEAAQIEQVEAGGAKETTSVLLTERGAQLRQFVQRIANIVLALLEEFLAADGCHRDLGHQVGTTNARAGDDDGVVAAGGRSRFDLDFGLARLTVGIGRIVRVAFRRLSNRRNTLSVRWRSLRGSGGCPQEAGKD